MGADANEFDDDNVCDIIEVGKHSNNGRFNTKQLLGTAVHAAAITMVKAFDESVVDKNREIMDPACSIWDNIMEVNNISYAKALNMTNLKPILLRPVHPHHLLCNPVVFLAMTSTVSFERQLQSVNDNLQWIERNGASYLLSKKYGKRGTVNHFQVYSL